MMLETVFAVTSCTRDNSVTLISETVKILFALGLAGKLNNSMLAL